MWKGAWWSVVKRVSAPAAATRTSRHIIRSPHDPHAAHSISASMSCINTPRREFSCALPRCPKNRFRSSRTRRRPPFLPAAVGKVPGDAERVPRPHRKAAAPKHGGGARDGQTLLPSRGARVEGHSAARRASRDCSAKTRVLWYAQDCAGALLLLIDTVMRSGCPSGRREHNGAYSWAARSCVFFPSRTLARSCSGGVGWWEDVGDSRSGVYLFSFAFLHDAILF